jgi:hypothetical protein
MHFVFHHLGSLFPIIMDSTSTSILPDSVDMSPPLSLHRASLHVGQRTSLDTPIPPSSSLKGAMNVFCEDILDDIELSTKADSESSREMEKGDTLDTIAALGLSFKEDEDQPRSLSKYERFSLEDTIQPGNQSLQLESNRPFNKWVRTLQRRAANRRQTVSGDYSAHAYENEYFESSGTHRNSSHKKSSSGSSFGFVTAVKSASISLASFSVAPRSRRTGISSRQQQRTDLSSKTSNRGRLSEDSSYISRGLVIDQAVTNRLLQRRRILEELITTEESYVADVKFLKTGSKPFSTNNPH